MASRFFATNSAYGFSTKPQYIFVPMLITAGAFGIQVPFEICIAKDSGSVDLKYLWTLTISCCFWTLYSWFVNDMLFYYACLSTIILMLSAIFFWHRLVQRQRTD